MHVLERFDQLIHDILFVNFFQDIGPNDCMKVSFHVLEDEVQVTIVFGLEHIQQPNDVVMAIQVL